MVTLQQVQATEIEMLAEVDRICEKHGITYYLTDGTLLGAVRHGGVIPWDDDVDVSMPRDQFERFEKVVRDELPAHMSFNEPADFGERAFHDFIPHIAYEDSQVKAPDAETAFYGERLNHIMLDILILDRATADSSQDARVRLLKYRYGLSWGHRYRIDYGDYTAAQKPVVFILSHLGKLYKQSSLNAAYTGISASAPSDSDRLFLSNTLLDELHNTYERAWFEQTVRLPFAGLSLPAPAGYDAILTQLYGDYHAFPPEEKRVPEHYDLDDPGLRIG